MTINKETTFIYSLSDKKGNIRYIGKSYNLNRRIKDHITEAKKVSNTYKNRWILSLLNKNEIPIIEIIDEVSIFEWEYWEKFYILLFKSWGFHLTNTTIGGNGTGSGINNPNYGKKLTDEHKMKCSLKLRGDKNPFFGKKHSPEIMLKIYKPVLQYSIDGEFINEWNSIKEVEDNLKLHSISSCCHNKLLSVGGFIWRFKENNEFPKIIIVNKTYRKPVLQFTKDNVFIKKWKSGNEAEKELKIKHISKVCNKYKSHKTSGGFIWKYED